MNLLNKNKLKACVYEEELESIQATVEKAAEANFFRLFIF